VVALIACGSNHGADLCSAGGLCPNGTAYQACASADGKTCSYQLGAQKFTCQSCANCAGAIAALTQACTNTIMGPPIADLSGFVDQHPDLSNPFGLDLSNPFGLDLSGGGKVGCHSYVPCLNDCLAANPTTATLMSCETTCNATAKATAATEFNNALGCGQQYCLGSTATPYKCKLDSTGASLLNMDGTMIMSSDPTTGNTGTKDCGACLNDSLAKLFGNPCESSVPADCSTATSGAVVTQCGATTNACVNDLP
jgi:hypothetical protein